MTLLLTAVNSAAKMAHGNSFIMKLIFLPEARLPVGKNRLKPGKAEKKIESLINSCRSVGIPILNRD